jgi:hypothetical protein
MKALTLTRTLTLSLCASVLLAAATAQAMPRPRTAADYGTVVTTASAGRVIVIDARTRYVNVTNGETVRFEVDGKRFTFSFDAWRNDDSVDLSTIAPAGVMVPKVRVYIAQNPLYVG